MNSIKKHMFALRPNPRGGPIHWLGVRSTTFICHLHGAQNDGYAPPLTYLACAAQPLCATQVPLTRKAQHYCYLVVFLHLECAACAAQPICATPVSLNQEAQRDHCLVALPLWESDCQACSCGVCTGADYQTTSDMILQCLCSRPAAPLHPQTSNKDY